jgi:hypothetical protein
MTGGHHRQAMLRGHDLPPIGGADRLAPNPLQGTISLASRTDLLYWPERAGRCPRVVLVVTALDDIPAPAANP